MEIPYFKLKSSTEDQSFVENDQTFDKKGVINLTVYVPHRGRIIVSISQNDQIEFLCRKIGEDMERFDQFRGVMGLRARNLRLKGHNEIIFNQKDRVYMHFKDGDQISCDLESEDLWIKCDTQYNSSFMRTWNSSFDLRVKQEASVFQMKKMLQKVAINYWNLGLSRSILYRKNITVLKLFQIVNRNYLPSINGIRSNSSHLSTLNIMQISDDQKVRDHFTFESQINVFCNFVTLQQQFNSQNPNFHKLHHKMLGFFGVGIPRKTTAGPHLRSQDSNDIKFSNLNSQIQRQNASTRLFPVAREKISNSDFLDKNNSSSKDNSVTMGKKGPSLDEPLINRKQSSYQQVSSQNWFRFTNSGLGSGSKRQTIDLHKVTTVTSLSKTAPVNIIYQNVVLLNTQGL